jgi:curli biogenesis system outer membrane secretion channel CsgG
MKIAIVAALAAASLSACVTAPTDPVQLAAWKAEKTARTEARRPEAGSIVAGQRQDPDDFDTLKEQVIAPATQADPQ